MRSLAILFVLVTGVAQAEELRIDVDGDLFFARTSGAGSEVVIAIPGGPGLSHEYLLPLEKLASPTRRVILYDPRGTGHTRVPGPYELESQAADLEAIRKFVGAEKIHILAHSWGTVIALAYADSYPNRVSSLMLVGMGAPTESRDRMSFEPLFAARKATLMKAGVVVKKAPKVRGDDCMPLFDAVLPVHFFDPKHADAWTLPGTYRCAVGRQTKVAAAGWDFRSTIAHLPMPLLLISGEADLNNAGLEQTVRLAPAAKLTNVRLPRCGHFPWLECPEPFFAALEKFL